MMTGTKKPTIKQVKARMLDIHRQLLEHAAGHRVLPDVKGMAEARGRARAHDTLCRWGALDADGITDFGRQLIDQDH